MTAETHAEALRNLIERVEAGATNFDVGPLPVNTAVLALHALEGSLDAVARLEAPLRERGWTLSIYRAGDGEWHVRSLTWGNVKAEALAPTEARARLLAVLKALLHECEVPHAQR